MARPDRFGASNPRWLAMQAKQSILVDSESVAATAPNQTLVVVNQPPHGLAIAAATHPNSLSSSKSTSSRST